MMTTELERRLPAPIIILFIRIERLVDIQINF